MIIDSIIYLYELSGGGLPSTLRFCNHLETDGSNVSLGGNMYNAIPIISRGWDRQLKEALPRPSIIVSNLTSDISALVNTYGLVSARLDRIIIPIKNLDGKSIPDPNGIIKRETYYTDRIEWDNRQAVITLRSPLDQENIKLPRRTVGTLIE